MFLYELIDHPRYKYRLERTYHHALHNFDLRTKRASLNPWVRLDHNLLSLSEGYAWDGASGPAVDTTTAMRGSAVHDALYQLVAAGQLPRKWKYLADMELVRICKQDGMGFFRRQWWYLAVTIFGNARDRYEA